MARKERTPEARDLTIPVFLPTSSGELVDIHLGTGSLKSGTLVIEFKHTLPGVAIQRMLERGTQFAISFTPIDVDEVNQGSQDRIKEEKIAAELASLPEDYMPDHDNDRTRAEIARGENI